VEALSQRGAEVWRMSHGPGTVEHWQQWWGHNLQEQDHARELSASAERAAGYSYMNPQGTYGRRGRPAYGRTAFPSGFSGVAASAEELPPISRRAAGSAMLLEKSTYPQTLRYRLPSKYSCDLGAKVAAEIRRLAVPCGRASNLLRGLVADTFTTARMHRSGRRQKRTGGQVHQQDGRGADRASICRRRGTRRDLLACVSPHPARPRPLSRARMCWRVCVRARAWHSVSCSPCRALAHPRVPCAE